MHVGVLCYNYYDHFYEAFKLVSMPVLLSMGKSCISQKLLHDYCEQTVIKNYRPYYILVDYIPLLGPVKQRSIKVIS